MKKDIKTFRALCRKHGLTGELLYDFSDFVHGLKDSGYKGSGKRGDFTYKELDELAAQFKADLLGTRGHEIDEENDDAEQ